MLIVFVRFQLIPTSGFVSPCQALSYATSSRSGASHPWPCGFTVVAVNLFTKSDSHIYIYIIVQVIGLYLTKRFGSKLPLWIMTSPSLDLDVVPPHEPFVCAFESFPKLREVAWTKHDPLIIQSVQQITRFAMTFTTQYFTMIFLWQDLPIMCLGRHVLVGGSLWEALHEEEADDEGRHS